MCFVGRDTLWRLPCPFERNRRCVISSGARNLSGVSRVRSSATVAVSFRAEREISLASPVSVRAQPPLCHFERSAKSCKMSRCARHDKEGWRASLDLPGRRWCASWAVTRSGVSRVRSSATVAVSFRAEREISLASPVSVRAQPPLCHFERSAKSCKMSRCARHDKEGWCAPLDLPGCGWCASWAVTRSGVSRVRSSATAAVSFRAEREISLASLVSVRAQPPLCHFERSEKSCKMSRCARHERGNTHIVPVRGSGAAGKGQ